MNEGHKYSLYIQNNDTKKIINAEVYKNNGECIILHPIHSNQHIDSLKIQPKSDKCLIYNSNLRSKIIEHNIYNLKPWLDPTELQIYYFKTGEKDVCFDPYISDNSELSCIIINYLTHEFRYDIKSNTEIQVNLSSNSDSIFKIYTSKHPEYGFKYVSNEVQNNKFDYKVERIEDSKTKEFFNLDPQRDLKCLNITSQDENMLQKFTVHMERNPHT